MLRERVSENIGDAGDSELMSLNLTSRIVVSVPADTKIYVVFTRHEESLLGCTEWLPIGKREFLSMPRRQNRGMFLCACELARPLLQPPGSNFRTLCPHGSDTICTVFRDHSTIAGPLCRCAVDKWGRILVNGHLTNNRSRYVNVRLTHDRSGYVVVRLTQDRAASQGIQNLDV